MLPPDATGGCRLPPAKRYGSPTLGIAILRRLNHLGEQWRNDHKFVQWTVDRTNGWFDTGRPITTSVYLPGMDRRAEREH